MIKLLRALGAFFALVLAGFAPAVSARPAQHTQDAVQVAHPALWKVTGANATIYLFGTIHLLPDHITWFAGPVAAAFTKSDVLVTEILEKTPEEMRPVVAAKAMLPEGKSLRDEFSPGDRKLIEASLAANNLPAAGFDHFQPWYAAVALATMPIMKMGYDPANGVDAQLGKRAEALKKPHEALETAEFQLGLFASLPQPVQRKYLLEVVKHLPEVKTELTGMIRSWKLGNAAQLAALMNSDEDDPQMMQTLLIDRNTNWAQWIKARLAKPAKPHETVFIAVGAGHLAGPGSVMDQLQKLGIQSRRLQ